jgi:hypothetical protein
MLFQLEKNIYDEHGITENPTILSSISFLNGTIIDTNKINTPLVFESDFNTNNPPKHFLGNKIPVVSSQFKDLLQQNGVDNFQAIEATITNSEEDLQWNDYYAFNVIGLLACVDLSKSKYTVIDPGGGIMLPLLSFKNIAIQEEKVKGFKLFRLAESPDILIIDESVLNAIKSNPLPGGWGITVTPVS